MKRKTVFYVVFFSVLVVGFFVAMGVVIPGFTQKSVPPISTVKPFVFTNQDGEAVTSRDVAGKVYVVEYFFTTCPSICPRMNNNMKRVHERFKEWQDDFLILSHTCDPETDTPEKLRQYADSIGADTKQWIFLTGTKDSLYNMARHSYKIDDPNNHMSSPDVDFLHSQFFAVVNRRGEVVSIYDGLKETEVDAMMGKISELIREPVPETSGS